MQNFLGGKEESKLELLDSHFPSNSVFFQNFKNSKSDF